MKHVAVVLIVLALISLSGCGGGSSTTNTTPTAGTTRVQVPVSWPTLTRSITPSAFSRSIEVTLQGANVDGTDFKFVINRGSNEAAFTQTYTSPTPVRTGTWEMEVRCLSEADAAGTVVSDAVAGVKVGEDGHGIGTIDAGESAISLIVRPLELSLPAGASEMFHAEVRGTDNKNVVWSVQEGTSGGSITAAGRYTAPSVVGTYHVVATSQADLTRKASAVVHVLAAPVPGTDGIRVTITPPSLEIFAKRSETFVASVTGTDDKSVFWSIQEGPVGGYITDGGRYTAGETPGEYHIVATSRANHDKKAVARVIVKPVSPTPGEILVSVAPEKVFLDPGKTQAFTANVQGTDNKGVTWSIQEGTLGGSITDGGVYTAPAKPGEYHVIARSKANADKLGRAVIFVRAPETSIVVTLLPERLELLVGRTETFHATVAGTDNKGVIWSIQEGAAGGKITDGGVYTAPNVTGEFHVIARSTANPNRFDTAVVIVKPVVVPPITVTITPSPLLISPGGTETLTATVLGTDNKVVTWTILEGADGGSITDGGVYTAPATPGEYHVTATSAANPLKNARVTVKVVAPL